MMSSDWIRGRGAAGRVVAVTADAMELLREGAGEGLTIVSMAIISLPGPPGNLTRAACRLVY